ncbi:hypothetical protein GGR54DRAFT_622107 [Hypoxylon sp. NC1633]|nr:hypothetical protein GGR54DRAFT_622107 [Hypoxylon sp. NC1633]
MDWLPDSDLFIAPNRFDTFEYVTEPLRKGQHCQVIQNFRLEEGKDAETPDLKDAAGWTVWLQKLGFVSNTDSNKDRFTIDRLPRDGFRILCIPQAEDLKLAGGQIQHSTYTDLPVVEANWKKVAKAFYLPGHFPKLVARNQSSVISIARTHTFSEGQHATERLWMHTAVIPRPKDVDSKAKSNPDNADSFADDDADPFAIAATHFEGRHFTAAVMFGCSNHQIDRMRKLVNTWKEAKGHPLLMLGIYAELQLDRLNAVVGERDRAYETLIKKVGYEAERKSKDRFGWELIKEVRSTREVSMKVQEEVNATKLQLRKACDSALKTLETPKDQRQTDQRQTDQMPEYQRPTDQRTSDTTNLFSERFNDIITSFDGLSARCRIIVEGISFTTDIIRSELTRQEAQTSAKNSKSATAISLVAMIYLPVTTMATIFAMPIFQWSNDWRDWRYRPVDDGNQSSDGSQEDPSNATMVPVVSGYIWLYISISTILTLVTIFGFRFYMSFKNSPSPASPPPSLDGQRSSSPLSKVKEYFKSLRDRVPDAESGIGKKPNGDQ